MKNNLRYVALFLLWALVSCKKDKLNFDKFSTSQFSPEYGAPLASSDLTIREILTKADKNNNIYVDGSGFCTLIYRGTLFTSKAKDFIQVPNQSISPIFFNVAFTPGLFTFNSAPNGTSFGPFSQNIVYTVVPTPPLIDSIYCGNGTILSINMVNTIPATITFTLFSSSIVDLATNQPFNKVISVTTSTNVSYNLANHLLKLNDGVGRSRLNLSYIVSMQKSGTAAPTDNVSISLALNNINYTKFIGFLGNNFTHPNFAPYKDTVPISLFKSTEPLFANTIFSLVDPKFDIKFYNEIGATALLNFNKFNAYTPDPFGNNLNPQSLIGSPVLQNLTILKANNFNAPVTTTLSVNKNNEPNVVPFLNSRPKNVIYEVNGSINPGSSPYIRNFVTDTSKIRVDMDVILPLWGNMKNLVFVDTPKVNLSDLNVDNIKKATIRTYFESTFPFTMGTEIVFLDSLNNILYTFLQPGTVVIPGAVVDNNGVAANPSIIRKDYELSYNVLVILKNTKKFRIRAFAESTNYPQNVKVYDFQKLKVKVGLAVQPKFQ